MGATKRCKSCKQVKPLDSYHKTCGASGWRFNHCKVCRHQKQEKVRVLREYGISYEQYDILLTIRAGICELCSKPCSDPRKRKLNVDHLHSTGEVRGLICNRCNLLIKDEDPGLLRKAADYLEGVKSCCGDKASLGRPGANTSNKRHSFSLTQRNSPQKVKRIV